MSRRAVTVTVAAFVTLVCVPAAGAAAADRADLRLRLRETARTEAFRTPPNGSWRLTITGTTGTRATPATVGVLLGTLALEVPLDRGRFSGVLDMHPARPRVVVRARRGRLTIVARGTAADGSGTVLGGAMLSRARAADFWNGAALSLERGAVVVDGDETDLGVGVAARTDRLLFPAWRYDELDLDDTYRVSIGALGIVPRRRASQTLVGIVGARPKSGWTGRVAGHAVTTGGAASLRLTEPSGTVRDIAPLDAETFDAGQGTHVRAGVSRLDFDGGSVFQTRFDVAVAARPGPGRASVEAVSDGSAARVAFEFVAPANDPPTAADVATHVLENRDGGLWAWGRNEDGAVGDGSQGTPASPVALDRPKITIAIAAGGDFSVATDDEGFVYGWGEWRTRRARAGAADLWPDAPAQVAGLASIEALAAGDDHVLALDDDGVVWTLGQNEEGQLGDGTFENRPFDPRMVDGLPRIVSVAAGATSSYALDGSGTVWAWGGGATLAGSAARPAAIEDLEDVERISAGGDALLALDAEGAVWQVGSTGTTSLKGPPGRAFTSRVQVVLPLAATSIDQGAAHACAVLTDGTLWAWGANDRGQLGDGTTTSSSAPVKVRDLADVVLVAAGDGRTLAVTGDGATWTWGDHEFAPGTIGWRSGRHGTYPVLVRRTFRAGRIVGDPSVGAAKTR